MFGLFLFVADKTMGSEAAIQKNVGAFMCYNLNIKGLQIFVNVLLTVYKVYLYVREQCV